MINKVYKVNFDRSAEDLSLQYEGLSDTEKECMSDLSAESFFDYEDNKGKYICYLINQLFLHDYPSQAIRNNLNFQDLN